MPLSIMVLISLSILLGLAYAALIIFYHRGWSMLEEFHATDKVADTGVSVIIAARNEEKRIATCIQAILEQDFPKEQMEVLVVNDHSDDRTDEIVKSFDDPRIRLLDICNAENEELRKGTKKAALTYGVQNAKNPLILATDADCVPVKTWVRTIVSFFEENDSVMIAGPVMYRDDSSWLQRFQSLDFTTLIGIAASCIRQGFPNMANGANLAYTRDMFMSCDGYSDNSGIPTGDDIFLMIKAEREFPGKVHYLLSNDALVYTIPESGLVSFLQQRFRWLSKSTQFTDKRITATLIGAYLFNFIILLDLILGLSSASVLFYCGIGLFIYKSLLDLSFVYPVIKQFGRKDLLLSYLSVQPVHIVYVVIVGLIANFMPYSWKGRRYRPI